MKLFVIDKNGNKIYLRVNATTRRQLFEFFPKGKLIVNNQVFPVDKIMAEATSDQITTSAAVGGAIGLIGGAAGVGIGALIGGLIGKVQENTEKEKVERFNKGKN